MDCVSPEGPVYQAGTLSGNPLAMAAGLETLRIITEDPNYIEKVTEKTSTLTEGIRQAAEKAGVQVQVPQAGTMFSVFSATDRSRTTPMPKAATPRPSRATSCLC